MRVAAGVLFVIAAALALVYFLRSGGGGGSGVLAAPEELAAAVAGGKPAAGVPVEDVVPSRLSLTLIGTVVRPSGSLATLQSPSRRAPYLVGAHVEDLAEIVRIERDRVIIRNFANGFLESVQLAPFAPGLAAGSAGSAGLDRDVQVSRSAVDAALGNLVRVLSEAAVEPVTGGAGYRVTMLKPGSVFESLGLRVGDELFAVNGEKLESVEKVLVLFNELRASSLIELRLRRAGAEHRVTYLVR